MMNYDGAFSASALEAVAQSLTDTGFLPTWPPISALYAPGFVELRP